MASITSTLPTSLKRNRSTEDRDSRQISSSKLRKIVSNTFIPSRPLWHSEDKIRIIAEQIISNQKITYPDRTPECLLGLFYISAHFHSFNTVDNPIDPTQISNTSRNLLHNLEIEKRSIVYKVLPLMDGEFGRKMRSIAAPILYDISSTPTYENHFKYSVREILQEGLELSNHLLRRSKENKEEFDFLCEKIPPLQHHSSEERHLCLETWNKSLEARLTLLKDYHEIGLPRYELIDYYVQDPNTKNYSFHSTRLFNLFDNTRPEQKPEHDSLGADLNPFTRNPAWIFSTAIEGLNIDCKNVPNDLSIQELRIKEDPIIKMTDGRVPRPTFALLSTLHEPTLDDTAVDVLKKFEETYHSSEALKLPYSAFLLEVSFLKGRVTNFRPAHWPANNESPLMQIEVPNWTTLATELEKFISQIPYIVQDMAECETDKQTDSLQLEESAVGTWEDTLLTDEDVGKLLFPEGKPDSDGLALSNYFSEDF